MRLSGYTTTHQCLERGYPIELTLKSMYSMCDEVVVVDAGSTDGTPQYIYERYPDIKLYKEPVDFRHPRWAIHSDGWLKAKARAYCTGDACLQMDSDEYMIPSQGSIIRGLAEKALREAVIIAIPVYEFWGELTRLRLDVGPKPRISGNFAGITHGIPADCLEHDLEGHPYPRPVTSDTCCYINKGSGQRLAIQVDHGAPGVWHTSWLDFERKIKHHRQYWNMFHASMYNQQPQPTMFNKPWKEVTDEDITEMAEKLRRNGPRFFHEYVEEWQGRTMPLQPTQVPEDIRRYYDESLDHSAVSGSS